MKVILIDAKYLGGAMCYARKCSGLNRQTAAQMLNIPYREYAEYERGIGVIPERTLQSIMTDGFILMRTKKRIKNK